MKKRKKIGRKGGKREGSSHVEARHSANRALSCRIDCPKTKKRRRKVWSPRARTWGAREPRITRAERMTAELIFPYAICKLRLNLYVKGHGRAAVDG